MAETFGRDFHFKSPSFCHPFFCHTSFLQIRYVRGNCMVSRTRQRRACAGKRRKTKPAASAVGSLKDRCLSRDRLSPRHGTRSPPRTGPKCGRHPPPRPQTITAERDDHMEEAKVIVPTVLKLCGRFHLPSNRTRPSPRSATRDPECYTLVKPKSALDSVNSSPVLFRRKSMPVLAPMPQ
jgi:hypothetical protein